MWYFSGYQVKSIVFPPKYFPSYLQNTTFVCIEAAKGSRNESVCKKDPFLRLYKRNCTLQKSDSVAAPQQTSAHLI